MALLYESESYAILGAAMHVYAKLRPGFVEPIYQDALEIELTKRGIPFEREKELQVFYEGKLLKHFYKADFICYGNIILELKATSEISESHISQLINYLKATNIRLGFVLNFGNKGKLGIERIIM